MKKLLIVFCILSVWIGLAVANYPVIWKKLDYIDPGNDFTRGIAYNRLTDHVLVVSRKGGLNVYILDAATGTEVGKMNTDGISGGTYAINLVACSEDGIIYVCNLSAPQYTPTSTFKIYRYENESAAPQLVFDDALAKDRYGDSFAVIGSGANKILYASGMENSKLVVLRDTGAATLTVDHFITLPVPGNARHGISPVEPLGNLWINAAGPMFPPTLITDNGTLVAKVPDSLASAGGTSGIKHLIMGQRKFVIVANGYSASIRAVEYMEDELGTVTFKYFGGNSDSLALSYNNVINSNPNATGHIAYDSKRNALLTVIGMNSVASLSFDKMLKTSTPRDSNAVISIDGWNDFYPTDHIGRSNGRDMYLTWDEGKVFCGITGHTIVDPALINRIIWAFDLDPDGDNGSSKLPDNINQAGIGSLPFKADVIYSVEPWNSEDYMTGQIFKWNNGNWAATNFDGNLAAQGALAYAAEGPGKIAEIAAIKNANGIGSSFTKIAMMAYVVQQLSGGEVLSAFPPQNPTGKVTAFTHYYYAETLGAGMFPTDEKYVQIKQSTSTAVSQNKEAMPCRFGLMQNYPNPFNATTRISYTLDNAAMVKLEVFDVAGKWSRTLVHGKQDAGKHQLTFDAQSLSSGVYYLRLNVEGRTAVKKMAVVK